MDDVGVVAVGRNEGERLRRCLASVLGRAGARAAAAVVYVDSDSADGSAALARGMGAEVVELDMSLPFSAARARNEGFAGLQRVAPGVRLVQFVDGDCEVAPGWLAAARAALDARPDLAVVCGRRRERFPERSVYNRLADVEWDTPVGDARTCGGDAMVRVEAFQQVGGYDPAVIAGEEPEMCVRLRQRGWTVARIDAEMTVHDADMTRFAQFWRRMVRGGHAYAEGAWMHGRAPERHCVRETRGIVLWGLALPAVILLLATLAPLWRPLALVALGLLCLYPLQVARVALRDGRRRRKLPPRQAWAYAASVTVGKFAQAVGAAKFWTGKLRGRRAALIEYKGGAAPAAVARPSAEAGA